MLAQRLKTTGNLGKGNEKSIISTRSDLDEVTTAILNAAKGRHTDHVTYYFMYLYLIDTAWNDLYLAQVSSEGIQCDDLRPNSIIVFGTCWGLLMFIPQCNTCAAKHA